MFGYSTFDAPQKNKNCHYDRNNSLQGGLLVHIISWEQQIVCSSSFLSCSTQIYGVICSTMQCSTFGFILKITIKIKIISSSLQGSSLIHTISWKWQVACSSFHLFSQLFVLCVWRCVIVKHQGVYTLHVLYVKSATKRMQNSSQLY
jgi:hypothetical protein